MKSKLIKITFFLVVLLIPIGVVLSNGDLFQGYVPGHTGDGCHNPGYPGTNDISGNIELTSSIGQTVGPGESFTVEAKITGFDGPGGSHTVALGFLDYKDSNGEFNIDPKSIKDVTVTTGTSTTESFDVIAPSKEGTYILTASAIWGGSSGSPMAYQYVHDSISINVSIKVPTSYISVANYLVNTANRSNGGYRWEVFNGSAVIPFSGDSPVYYTGWGEGVAGVGDFLIEAYNKSENSLYLNYSIGAARWLWSVRHNDGYGAHWSIVYNASNSPILTTNNFTGISQGVAGIGRFFLNLYKQTFNTTYSDWAEEAAKYLLTVNATGLLQGQMAWSQDDSNSEISHTYIKGTPGIGVFLMELATVNSTYGWWARNASNYMISAADTSKTGAFWNSTSVSLSAMTGIWRGAAGIGSFLLDIYEKYGNTNEYSYANKTFDWLDSTKVETQSGYVWDNVLNDGDYHSCFDEGIAGISTFLYRLYNITGNATHLELVQGALNHLIDNKTIDDDGKFWWKDSSVYADQYSGKVQGMAGIGDAILYALNYTNNATYAIQVEGIYTWYSKIGLRYDVNDSLTTAWGKSTKTGESNETHSGIFSGAAGAGFFLLKRAEFLDDTKAPDSGYLATPVVSGKSVSFNVSDAVDLESYIKNTVYYLNGDPYITNGTELTTTLPAGSYTAYAIIFDKVGNPRKTNSTTFIIRATTITTLIVDDSSPRDLWEEDYTLLYYGLIFIFIGAASIILVKMQFKRVSYRKH